MICLAGTLACLTGADIAYNLSEANELKPYFQELDSKKYVKGNEVLQIILFLKGNFETLVQ